MWRLGICAGVGQIRSCTLQSSVLPFPSQLQHLKAAKELQDWSGSSPRRDFSGSTRSESGREVPLLSSRRRSRLLQRLLARPLLYFPFSAAFSFAGHGQGGAEGSSLCPWWFSVAVPGPCAGWQQRHGHRVLPEPRRAPTRSIFSHISTGFSPYLIFYLPLSIQERHSSVFSFKHGCCCSRFSKGRGTGQPVTRGHFPGVGDTAARTSPARCLSGTSWPGKGNEIVPQRFLSEFY